MSLSLSDMLSQSRQVSKIKKKGYPHEIELLEIMLEKPVNEAWVKESYDWLKKIEQIRKEFNFDDIRNEETFKTLKKWHRYGLEHASNSEVVRMHLRLLKENLSSPNPLFNKHREAFYLTPTLLLKYAQKFPSLSKELFDFETFKPSPSLFYPNQLYQMWSRKNIAYFFQNSSLEEFKVLLKGFQGQAERDYIGGMLLPQIPSPSFLQGYLDEGYAVSSLNGLWTPTNPKDIECMLSQLMDHPDGPNKIQELLYTAQSFTNESFLLPPQWMEWFNYDISVSETPRSFSKNYFQAYLSSLKEFDPTMFEFKTQLGWTFLHVLAFLQKSDWFDLLVDQGLNPLALNNKGQTPREIMEEALMWATFQRAHGSIEEMRRDDTFQAILESKELSQTLEKATSKTPKNRL